MQDIMTDLETLGQSAGCVIVSIGAVAFDPETGEMGEEFYRVISINSSVTYGLRFDQGTLDWWKKQSDAARGVLKAAYAADALPLPPALHDFARYLDRATKGKNPRLWGNGADFDNAILASAYKAAGIETPWRFWDSRCFRTLKNLHPEVPTPTNAGTAHNALDDAKTQAIHALKIFAHLRDLKARPDALEQEWNRPPEPPMAAVAALRHHQRQLDADGIEVAVSRQALDEVMKSVGWGVAKAGEFEAVRDAIMGDEPADDMADLLG